MTQTEISQLPAEVLTDLRQIAEYFSPADMALELLIKDYRSKKGRSRGLAGVSPGFKEEQARAHAKRLKAGVTADVDHLKIALDERKKEVSLQNIPGAMNRVAITDSRYHGCYEE